MTPDGAKKGNKVEEMELKDYRELIDKADDELMRGFIARMEVSAQLSAYKKAHGLQVYDPARIRRSRAADCSGGRIFFISRRSTRCSPPLKRAAAPTA